MKKKSGTKKKNSINKGDVLERAAKLLYEMEDILFEKNISLPCLGEPERTREFDLVGSKTLIGKEMVIPIECKNYNKAVNVKTIDSFIGQMEDVGIPPAHGILISSKGFTQGAIQRAKKVGISTLTLEGLTNDGLKTAINRAISSTVFIFPCVKTISDLGPHPELDEDRALDQYQRLELVNDALWKVWCLEKFLPEGFDSYTLKIEIKFDNSIYLYFIRVANHAILIDYFSDATVYKLKNEKDEVTRARVDLGLPDKTAITYCCSKEDLEKQKSRKTAKVLVQYGTRKLNRIKVIKVFWPPSPKAREIYKDFSKSESPEDIVQSRINITKDFLSGPDMEYIKYTNTRDEKNQSLNLRLHLTEINGKKVETTNNKH